MLECQFPRFSKIPPKGGREKRRNGAWPQMAICEKGFWGRCHQQAKTDFRRSRRKSVLSLCGNKGTACKVVYLRKTSYATSSLSSRTQYSKKSLRQFGLGLLQVSCPPLRLSDWMFSVFHRWQNYHWNHLEYNSKFPKGLYCKANFSFFGPRAITPLAVVLLCFSGQQVYSGICKITQITFRGAVAAQ